MKKLIKVAAVLLFVIAGPRLNAEDAVLYWMVNDPAVYEYDERGTLLNVEDVRSRPDGKTINGARVHVTNASGTIDAYLSLLNSDYSESSASYVAVNAVSSGAGYDVMVGGPAMSYVISDYMESSAVFTMELGHWEGDEWLIMAVSKGESWESLRQFSSISDIGTPGGRHWAPEAAYVPEPSSGLLLFIGGALLALRRKRAAVVVWERGSLK